MRLNDNYLVSKWENGLAIKRFFLSHQLDKEHLETSTKYKFTEDEWKLREWAAHEMVKSPADQRIYFITPRAQEEAGKLVTDRKINTKWFATIPEQTTIYVTGRDEFFRFEKCNKGKYTGDAGKGELHVLFFFMSTTPGLPGQADIPVPRYQSFTVPLDGTEVNLAKWQSPLVVDRFLSLLLFVECGEVELLPVKKNEKVRWDKGGDDKLLNEAMLDGVTIVTPNWNKIYVSDDYCRVSSHYRMQPYGPKAAPTHYKMKLIPEHKRGPRMGGGAKAQMENGTLTIGAPDSDNN